MQIDPQSGLTMTVNTGRLRKTINNLPNSGYSLDHEGHEYVSVIIIVALQDEQLTPKVVHANRTRLSKQTVPNVRLSGHLREAPARNKRSSKMSVRHTYVPPPHTQTHTSTDQQRQQRQQQSQHYHRAIEIPIDHGVVRTTFKDSAGKDRSDPQDNLREDQRLYGALKHAAVGQIGVPAGAHPFLQQFQSP